MDTNNSGGKVALITGVTGQDGSYLAELLLSNRTPGKAQALAQLQGRYDVEDGDLGMHVLVAPPRTPRTGTTDVVMTAVMRWCLRDPRVQRVVVEPDATNDAILAKNLRAGFRSRGLLGRKSALEN